MFLVKYTRASRSDGTGDLMNRFKEFPTRKDAEIFIAKEISGNLQFSNIQIFTNVLDQIDYKEKFEELYNYVLSQAGVRAPIESTPEKVETIVK